MAIQRAVIVQAVTISVCMVLGAVINVLVAWRMLHAAEDPNQAFNNGTTFFELSASPDTRGYFVSIVGHRWTGVTYYAAWPSQSGRYPKVQTDLTQLSESSLIEPLRLVFETFPKPVKQEGFGFFRERRRPALLVTAGWPWPSVWCVGSASFTIDHAAYPEDTYWTGPGVETVLSGGWQIERGLRRSEARSAYRQPDGLKTPLPFRPLWPGFLGNTLVFGGAVYLALLVVFLPIALVRRHRRRVNVCLKCGYSLLGLPATNACPECGTPR